MDLTQEQRQERSKYVVLEAVGGQYGSSNHGRNIRGMVSRWVRKGLVDLGCGRNHFCQSLQGRGLKALGVDWAFPEADVPAPMWATGLPSGAFDVVTAFDSLEHLLPDDLDRTLDEILRLAPGGRFAFTIGTHRSTRMIRGQETDLHPIRKPLDWWEKRIERIGCVTARHGQAHNFRGVHPHLIGRIR